MLATPGTATLEGSLLHKNVSTRLDPPAVASRELLVSLTADEWDPIVETNLTLQRIMVANIRVSALAVEWSGLELLLKIDCPPTAQPPTADVRPPARHQLRTAPSLAPPRPVRHPRRLVRHVTPCNAMQRRVTPCNAMQRLVRQVPTECAIGSVNGTLVYSATRERELAVAAAVAGTASPCLAGYNHAATSGWNALMERELLKDVTRHEYYTSNNRTAPTIGTGNITIELLDRATLRLRLPDDAPYSISRP